MYKEAVKLLKDIDPKLYVDKYLTGSYPITKKTVYKDIDFVLYTHTVKKLEDELKIYGFELCGEDLQWKYSERDVIAYRKGPLNIIIVDSLDRFRKWQAATLLATHLKCIEKADRIAIFELIIGVKNKQPKVKIPDDFLDALLFDNIKPKDYMKHVLNQPQPNLNVNNIRGKGKQLNWMIIDDVLNDNQF